MLFMIKAQYDCTSYVIIIILLKLLQKWETMLSQLTFFTPLYDNYSYTQWTKSFYSMRAADII